MCKYGNETFQACGHEKRYQELCPESGTKNHKSVRRGGRETLGICAKCKERAYTESLNLYLKNQFRSVTGVATKAQKETANTYLSANYPKEGWFLDGKPLLWNVDPNGNLWWSVRERPSGKFN